MAHRTLNFCGIGVKHAAALGAVVCGLFALSKNVAGAASSAHEPVGLVGLICVDESLLEPLHNQCTALQCFDVKPKMSLVCVRPMALSSLESVKTEGRKLRPRKGACP